GVTDIEIAETGNPDSGWSSAADGNHYIQTSGSAQAFTLAQNITGLLSGATYTISYYFISSIDVSITGTCSASMYQDSIDTEIASYSWDPADADIWTGYSTEWDPTSTSHTIIFDFDCELSDSGITLGWDLFQIVPEDATDDCGSSSPSTTSQISSTMSSTTVPISTSHGCGSRQRRTIP
ncbi:hypothetical protein BX600DRAFT_539087, partial [Xylariales sp. PMI_506]